MTSAPASPPAITGVDFVAVPTEEIEASVHFYGSVLGLPFVKRWGERPAAEFQAGNLTIAVIETAAFGMEFRHRYAPTSG